MESVLGLFRGLRDPNSANEAAKLLNELCDNRDAIPCILEIARSATDVYFVNCAVLTLKQIVNRLSDHDKDILSTIQDALIDRLQLDLSGAMNETIAAVVTTVLARIKVPTAALINYISESSDYSMSYFIIFTEVICIVGVDERLTRIARAKIGTCLSNGVLGVRLSGLLFMMAYSGVIGTSLLEEFGGVIPQILVDCVLAKEFELLVTFEHIFTKYHGIASPLFPLREVLEQLGNPCVSDTNATVLRSAMNNWVKLQPKGSLTPDLISTIMQQLITVSLRLLANEQDESTTTDEHFVDILAHLDRESGVALVIKATEALNNGHIVNICTILAIVDAASSCFGYFELTGNILRVSVTHGSLLIRKIAFGILSEQQDVVDFIRNNIDILLGSLCEWAKRPLACGAAAERDTVSLTALRYMKRMLSRANCIGGSAACVAEIVNVFLSSDCQSEVMEALQIALLLIVNSPESFEAGKIWEMVRCPDELIRATAIHAATTLISKDKERMRRYLSKDMFRLDFIFDVKFICYVLVCYPEYIELRGSGPAMMSVIEKTITEYDNDVYIYEALKTSSFLMVMFPELIPRAWAAWAHIIQSFGSCDADFIRSIEEVLPIVCKTIGDDREKCIALESAMLEHVKESFGRQTFDSDLYVSVVEMTHQYFNIVGLTRSVSNCITAVIGKIDVILNDPKCNENASVDLALVCFRLFSDVVKRKHNRAIGARLLDLAVNMIRSERYAGLVSIGVQICDIIERHIYPIDNKDLVDVIVKLAASATDTIPLSAFEFLFGMSVVDPGRFSVYNGPVTALCTQRLMSPCHDRELLDYLVALLVGLPNNGDHVELIESHLPVCRQPRVYQRVYEWICGQLQCRVSDKLFLSVVELFSQEVLDYIHDGFITIELVRSLLAFMKRAAEGHDIVMLITTLSNADATCASVIVSNMRYCEQSLTST